MITASVTDLRAQILSRPMERAQSSGWCRAALGVMRLVLYIRLSEVGSCESALESQCCSVYTEATEGRPKGRLTHHITRGLSERLASVQQYSLGSAALKHQRSMNRQGTTHWEGTPGHPPRNSIAGLTWMVRDPATISFPLSFWVKINAAETVVLPADHVV